MLKNLFNHRFITLVFVLFALQLFGLVAGPTFVWSNTLALNFACYLLETVLADCWLLGSYASPIFVIGAILWGLTSLGVPFVGILMIIIYVYLIIRKYQVARRSTGTPTAGGVVPSLNSLQGTNQISRRPIKFSTGSIVWDLLPKGNFNQSIASFHPRMNCGIPQFWRTIRFEQVGDVINVIDHVWILGSNTHNLADCYDPEAQATIVNALFGLSTVSIDRHGSKPNGKPEGYLKFRIPKKEAENVRQVITLLIQDTCEWQKRTRLGHRPGK